jgi:hypothetical protein
LFDEPFEGIGLDLNEIRKRGIAADLREIDTIVSRDGRRVLGIIAFVLFAVGFDDFLFFRLILGCAPLSWRQ